MPLFEPIFQALNEAEARYVVVGGVATVLHGFARFTADVDLIIDLSPAEAEKVVTCLTSLGFEPRAPVPAGDFADPAKRAEWTREKSMQVFSMLDPNDPMRAVDLFVENPLDFEDLWSRSKLVELEATSVRIASLADLIELKRIAGRPQDLVDIEQLEEIARRERDAE